MLSILLLASTLLNPSVKVACEEPNGWTFDVKTVEVEPGVCVAKVHGRVATPTRPPKFSVILAFPQLDCEYTWNPNFGCSGNLAPLPWWGSVFNVARTQPMKCWFNAYETNRLTIAVSELRREVKMGGGLREEDFCYYPSFTFFSGEGEPLTEYETEVRLDAREIAFHEAIKAAAAWQTRAAGGAPATPPPAAFEPLYSTWYNFHKDVTAATVEAECAEAAKLGMKVVILDDGWQCDDIERSYKSCGDWQISPRRFPDMAGHVARIHALGMKYMMWFAMPYVGEETAAFAKLKGKFLRYEEPIKAWLLDPRFPEARAHLRDIYLRALRDWDIDGFKLDFVDQFELQGAPDPAAADNYAGRDCRSIPEGVEKLLKEVTTALLAEKPGLLLEFRQAYVGPVIRKYGNMIRVGDCAGSQLRNRVHIANMRLMCDGTSVHSDMIRWNPDETPENAQRFILNSIFGTVQYSVMLRDASPEMKAMISKWIRFTDAHRETLLKGAFRPHFPQLNYPVIEAESAAERIVVKYDPAVKFELGAITKPTYVIDGVTGEITNLGGEIKVVPAEKAGERPTICLTAPQEGDATALVQGALNDAWKRGGATVVLEAGVWNVKGLRLRSHTTLHLRAGAIVKASRNCDDYDILKNDTLEPVAADEFTEAIWAPPTVRKNNDHIRKCASSWQNGVIRIFGATDVAIIGEIGSVLDGCNSYNPKGEELFRGVHMISAQHSTNIVLKGYTIVNSGNWAHNLKLSADITIEDVTVAAGHDGIHLSSADRVRIQRCKIDTGDDCIGGFDCEDLYVADCHFRTSSNLFRIGGRRILVERCDCSGPGSYAWRSALTAEEKAAGASSYGRARRNPLSFFTYYCDYTLDVRQNAGEIVFRNCRVDNVDRLIHYNFSGNDFWQKNRPLESLTFENIKATNVGKSLCFYGDKQTPAALKIKDSHIAFTKPVSAEELERMRKISAHLGHLPAAKAPSEFIRAGNVRGITLEDVTIEGMKGSCVRSFGNVEDVKLDDVEGVESTLEPATTPFVEYQI